MKNQKTKITKSLSLKEKRAILFLHEVGSITTFNADTPTLRTIQSLIDKKMVERSVGAIKLKNYSAGATKFVLSTEGKRKASILYKSREQ